MFCAFILVFSGTDGVESHFHVLRPNSISAVRRASGPIFMLWAPRLVSDGTEGVESHFHVLRPNSISAVRRASGPIFMLWAPRLVSDGTEGVESRFHVLCTRTHFRRCRVRRVPFSCFARPFSFSAVPRAWGLIFIFCAPILIFRCVEYVGTRFHVLRARTNFRRYRVRRVPFSCFARSDSFSAVSSTSGLVFMFCAAVLIFSGTEGVGYCFHILRAQTNFRRYRGRRVPFSCFALLFSFSTVSSALGPVSFFARSDSFSGVPRASGPVYMFCAPGLDFGGTDGVGSRFHVLRARTGFRGYGGRRVPFSCFDSPD
jgi:hypothetical protein